MSKFHRLIARVRTIIFGVKEFKAGHFKQIIFSNFLLYSVKGDLKLYEMSKCLF